jgi:glycosyltransferase involved in cell wall biosynthesis
VEGREVVLFPKCVHSIAEAVRCDVSSELVVTDWHSDDWPLNEWLEDAARPVPVQLLSIEGAFSRGRGLNVAAHAAQGEFLLFVDADVVISRQLIEGGMTHLREGKAVFPIVFSFKDPDHRDGWWRDKGFGQVMVTRETYRQSGGWPEYESWGQEDDDFHSKVSEVAPVIREKVEGFCHLWHPDDIGWKNRYGASPPRLGRDWEQIQVAKRELSQVISADAPFLLVDDAKFGRHTESLSHAIPFLEHDGEYWGAPNDDATAIDEFERLRRSGAAFIVFAWQAFWWIDYYPEFYEHLQENSRLVFENERLIVFDVRAHNR